MGLSNALFTGVSGLDTSGTAISVIGDNIANSNTPGFKSKRAEFGDLLAQSLTSGGGFSQLGSGSTLTRVRPIYSQGTFENTGRGTDLAIEGRGFFVVQSAQGNFYTRNGIFNFDADGFLVNTQNQRVQGFSIDPATGTTTGVLGDIQIQTAVLPPGATTSAEISVNLDANSGLVGPFDPADPASTSNFNFPMSVYDSLGNQHSVNFYFSRSATGWDWYAALDPTDTTTPPAAAGDQVVVQGSGSLSFDAQGFLQSTTGNSVTFEFAGGAAASQSVVLDWGPTGSSVGSATGRTTQFASPSAVTSFTQDGFASGQIQNIVIDGEGFLTGQFSNGETVPLAQLALASFANVDGLVATGNSNLVETRVSGQALIGAPQTGNLGTIRASSIEQSNVDMATEFVKLIINQRAFQANTRTIATTNDLLANLVALGQ
jgi:flagellar hook protein FlgE